MRGNLDRRREIGSRIRTLRQSQGSKLQDFAEEAGLSTGYLSEVERGQSAVSSEKLAAIARVLGTTTDYLLSGRNENPDGQGPEIAIPRALSDAAMTLELSHEQTIRLLMGRRSLVARRASSDVREWEQEDWIAFYENVKLYL